MKIKLIQIGKTEKDWLKEGIDIYRNRLQRYITFESLEISIPGSGKNQEEKQLLVEAEKLLGALKPGDWLVLLDDKGQLFSSEEMANWVNKKFVSLSGDLVFAIGGAFGFHSSVISRANEKISLSRLTFTHQMVRVIFLEQLYRAMTILKNEPYHHS